jgi:hypothetical protein
VLILVRIESLNTPQSVGLVIDMVIIKQLDTAFHSFTGSTNTGDVAECLTTALYLQKPLVSDLRRQASQLVLTLKMTHIHIFSSRKMTSDFSSVP